MTRNPFKNPLVGDRFFHPHGAEYAVTAVKGKTVSLAPVRTGRAEPVKLTLAALWRQDWICHENRFAFTITQRTLHVCLRHSDTNNVSSVGVDIVELGDDGPFYKPQIEGSFNPETLARDLRQLADALWLDGVSTRRPKTLEEAAALLGVECDPA